MSSLRQVCWRHAVYLLAAVVWLSFTEIGRADPKPLSKDCTFRELL